MASQKLTKTNSSCGYFLLGTVAGVEENIIVRAGKQTFAVIPPPSGNLWVSARGNGGNLKVGDDVRVSLTNTGRSLQANMINIYRQLEDRSSAKSNSSELESDNARKSNSRPQTRRPKTNVTRKARAPRTSSSARSPAERHFRLGVNMLKNGKRDLAIQYFKKSKAADPSEAMAKKIAEALEGKMTR